MNTSFLLEKIKYLKTHGDDRIVTDIVIDTRKVTDGCAFVCIKGFVHDGHDFADIAVNNGAGTIVMDSRSAYMNFYVNNQKKVASGLLKLILVENSRNALAELSDAFWGHPTGEFNLIGVTGTKGKTTTSLMIKKIYDGFSEKTGLIGTMYNMVGDDIIETDRTTPEANVLQPLFRRMADENVATCIMECSSQGLKLNRVGGCEFNYGIFTNLSPDHIGATEHPDMDDYAFSKGLLFTRCKKGIINIDSPYFEKITQNATCEIITYGIDKPADFKAENIKYGPDFVDYEMVCKDGSFPIHVNIPGKFSVYNSLAAAAIAYIDGVPMNIVSEALADIVVKGKAEIVPTGRDFTVMIDYAHNPDSFINIITTAKAFAKRVVFLFGAGGDRNRPRELMGETAASYADFVIITSDNPRTEDPASIVRDIEVGVKKVGKPYAAIVDRTEAINFAIKNALPGDVIILAGKGHETYQIFKDKTIHYDEREVVRDALLELK